MPLDDTAYYLERAATERKLAECSQNADVAAIHEDLARQYEALVKQAGLRPLWRRPNALPGRRFGGSRLTIL